METAFIIRIASSVLEGRRDRSLRPQEKPRRRRPAIGALGGLLGTG
jgi:hypothetical protein